MITETIYHSSDFHSGECECCGEKSNELIYTEDGREVCIDCIEEKEFYNETMEGNMKRANINKPIDEWIRELKTTSDSFNKTWDKLYEICEKLDIKI